MNELITKNKSYLWMDFFSSIKLSANMADYAKDTDYNVIDYGWESNLGPRSCNYLIPKIIEVLQILNVKRVADLGSGNGALCWALKNESYDVVGIEYDTNGYDIASKSYPNIHFYNLGVEANPNTLLETEDKFDAVVSTEVIEHLYSPHLLPIFSKGILKTDGYLIISTPYHGYIKNLLLSLLNHWDIHHCPLWHGGHIKFWSKKTITKLLNENGFELIQFVGVGRVSFLWKSMILIAKKNSDA